VYLSPAGSVALGLYPEGGQLPPGTPGSAGTPAAKELQLASELFQAKETIRSLLEELRDAEQSLSQSRAPSTPAPGPGGSAAIAAEGAGSVSKPQHARGGRGARAAPSPSAAAEPSPEIAARQDSPGSVSGSAPARSAWPEASEGAAPQSDGSASSGGLRQFRRNIDDLQAIRGENRRLREKCARQEQDLARARGRAEDLDRIRGELLRELNRKAGDAKGPPELQRALLQQEETLGDLGSRLEEELGKSKKLADRCFNQKNRVQLLEQRLEARDDLIEKQNRIIREAVAERAAAEELCEAHLQAAKSTRKLAQRAEAGREAAEQRLRGLAAEVERLAEACGQLEAVARAEVQQRGALAAGLRAAQERVAGLEGEARRHDGELERREEQAAALEHRCAGELHALRAQCTGLEAQLAAQRTESELRLEEAERRRGEADRALRAAQEKTEELRGVQAYDGGKLQALSDIVGLLHGHLAAQRRFRHAASDGLQSLSFDNFHPNRRGGADSAAASPNLEPFYVSPGGGRAHLGGAEGEAAPPAPEPAEAQLIEASESLFLDSDTSPGGAPPGLGDPPGGGGGGGGPPAATPAGGAGGWPWPALPRVGREGRTRNRRARPCRPGRSSAPRAGPRTRSSGRPAPSRRG